jgi:DNA-binding CsgD family transcriptional regulator
MYKDETLSLLIGEIYDAALDPSLWVGVLGKARDFVGGFAAALFSKDAMQKNGDVYYDDGGITPRYKQIYFESYVELDPATMGHYFAAIGQPVSVTDLLPYEEFVETRFYKEWVKPQGCVDFISATLDKTATNAAMFGVFRHERDGLADDETRQRMRLIVPHIRRAALIGRVIDLRTAEATTFTDTLDGLSASMFLVNEAGQIVHANASGHTMLADGRVLRAADGRLAASDTQAGQSLNKIFAMAGIGDASVGTKGIAVPLLANDGDHYMAHVLPLTSGARRRTGMNYAAAAALFVRKAVLEVPSPPEIIAKLYGLTPSELRVLLAIVQVGGVPETAQALGIGEKTVKTHLHRLFGKTGAGRQAELVKLVAGFSNPLVG